MAGALIVVFFLVSTRRLAQGSLGRVFAADALAAVLIAQAFLSANSQINGAQVRKAAVPFYLGDMYAVSRLGFRPPTTGELAQMQAALESDRFRAVLRCDVKSAGGICAAHAGSFWRLRLAEGYYGLGVPTRIAALPWATAASLRSIGFSKESTIPWGLLALMNVKYVIDASASFLFNSQELHAGHPLALISGRIQANPMSVTPRAFFAHNVIKVDSLADAVRRLSVEQKMPDLERESYAEGGPASRGLGGGTIEIIADEGDRTELMLSSSDQRRFLVLNELYFPGWTARANGTVTAVFATNGFMRGILLPPGTTRVVFEYVPFVRTATAGLLYSGGAILFLCGLLLSWRWSSQARTIERRLR